MILTKSKIETIAMTVLQTLQKYNADDCLCLYFNGKRLDTYDGQVTIKEGVHPIDYCAYASENNILTISSEGVLYDWYSIEYELPAWLTKCWEDLGLYYECNEDWNWSLYPSDDRYTEIEYDKKHKEKEEYIYYGKEGIPNELQMILDCWYKASAQTGDIGYCVIGQGMHFRYKGKKYDMRPASPYQGEGSWTKWVPMIEAMLRAIGATEIDWNCGRLD